MAKTIARCTGYDKGRTKEDHRLGSVASRAEASTYRTFAVAHVYADGSGWVSVMRDSKLLIRYPFPPENAPDFDTTTLEVSR